MAGLVQFTPAAELVKRDRAKALEEQATPVVSGLAGHIKDLFDAARTAKTDSNVEKRLLTCMRQRQGIYSGDKQAAITAQGGSEVWMHITETKCRAAESWLREILLSDEEAPWDLTSTPIPDIPQSDSDGIRKELITQAMAMLQQTGQVPPPEVIADLRNTLIEETRRQIQDKADKAIGNMKLKIKDQLAEGDWGNALSAFITDYATFPYAVLKSPVVEKRRRLTWDKATEYAPVVEDALIPVTKRVSPFDLYWEPGIANIQYGYVVEKHNLSRDDLTGMRGVPGYSKDAIELVLGDYENGMLNTWLTTSTEQKTMEGKTPSVDSPNPTFDALQFWGTVSGKLLREWGLTEEEVPDEFESYDVEAWLIGNYAIKAAINADPLGRKPYRLCSWIREPGSLVGKALPETIADIQDVCNASARALINNMGIASGPQVEVNVERLADGEKITQMYPWKIWQTKNATFGTSEPAIRFNQPQSIIEGLMGVYEKFSRLADDHSGIPAYVYGDMDVQGAGRTSSGLGMLMSSAGKSIKQVVMYVDQDIIKEVIHAHYEFNMLYDDDITIKGDALVVPRGALNLMIKDQVNQHRMQFLQMTANPVDMQIVGMDGRASVLREVAKGLEMPTKNIVPTEEQMKAKMSQPPPGPPGAPPGGPPPM